MGQRNTENRKSAFPRTNTSPKALKRDLGAIETVDPQKTDGKLQKTTNQRTGNLEKKTSDPWLEHQKLFKSDLGGKGLVVHSKDNTFSGSFVKEVNVRSKDWLTRLRPATHKNIVILRQAFYHAGDLHLFYELMDLCLAQVFATPFGQLKPYEVAAFCLEILSGLEYIHQSLKITHGNLTSETVLLSVEGAVKIADIGMCMLKDVDGRSSQEDVRSVGKIVIECLEPSTFLLQGESLTHGSWDPKLSTFVEQTKTKSAHELLQDDFLKLSPGTNCLKPYIRLARDSTVNRVKIIE